MNPMRVYLVEYEMCHIVEGQPSYGGHQNLLVFAHSPGDAWRLFQRHIRDKNQEIIPHSTNIANLPRRRGVVEL